jgi:hypothetical protein
MARECEETSCVFAKVDDHLGTIPDSGRVEGHHLGIGDTNKSNREENRDDGSSHLGALLEA